MVDSLIGTCHTMHRYSLVSFDIVGYCVLVSYIQGGPKMLHVWYAL